MEDYLNKVHLARSPDWITSHLQPNSIHLTITSPPVYDDSLYIMKDGSGEFGWTSFEEYLLHLEKLIEEVLRVTVAGGMFVIDTSSGPNEYGRDVKKLFHIPAEITHIAVKKGWIYWSEIVWVKENYLYDREMFKPPNVFARQKHSMILVFRKEGERDDCGDEVLTPSVWTYPHAEYKDKFQGYNAVYAVFPEKLLEKIISYWSCPGETILDPYAGSGQTIRAAMKLGRNAIGIEADRRWKYLWKDLG